MGNVSTMDTEAAVRFSFIRIIRCRIGLCAVYVRGEREAITLATYAER